MDCPLLIYIYIYVYVVYPKPPFRSVSRYWNDVFATEVAMIFTSMSWATTSTIYLCSFNSQPVCWMYFHDQKNTTNIYIYILYTWMGLGHVLEFTTILSILTILRFVWMSIESWWGKLSLEELQRGVFLPLNRLQKSPAEYPFQK